MKGIYDSWLGLRNTGLPLPRNLKRPRNDSDPAEDDDVNENEPKRQRGPTKAKVKADEEGGDKGKGKQKSRDGTMACCSVLDSQFIIKCENFYRQENILSWMDGIVAAGTPEKVGADIIRSNQEKVRAHD
jgi:hypothetical protein